MPKVPLERTKGERNFLNKIIESIPQRPYCQSSNGVIYNADCLEIMKNIPDNSVDLVLKKGLTNTTKTIIIGHEQKRIKKKDRFGGIMESPQSRNNMALSDTKMVNGEDSKLLRSQSNGDEQNNETSRHQITRSGQGRQRERSIHRRKPGHAVSSNGYQGQMFEVQGNEKFGDTSQKWQPSRQSLGESANSLCKLPQQSNKKTVVEGQKIVHIVDRHKIARQRLQQEILL